MLGYDLYRRGWNHDGGILYLGGDYLWYNYSLIRVSKGRLPVYYGPGLKARISENSNLGVRMAVGLEYQFDKAPFDVFVEIGPGITVLPSTEPDISAGLGGRFFF